MNMLLLAAEGGRLLPNQESLHDVEVRLTSSTKKHLELGANVLTKTPR